MYIVHDVYWPKKIFKKTVSCKQKILAKGKFTQKQKLACCLSTPIIYPPVYILGIFFLPRILYGD